MSRRIARLPASAFSDALPFRATAFESDRNFPSRTPHTRTGPGGSSSGKHDDMRFRQYINRLQKQPRPIICRSAGSGASRPGARTPKRSRKNQGSPPRNGARKPPSRSGKRASTVPAVSSETKGASFSKGCSPARQPLLKEDSSVAVRLIRYADDVRTSAAPSYRFRIPPSGNRSAATASVRLRRSPKNTTDEKRPAKIRRSV